MQRQNSIVHEISEDKFEPFCCFYYYYKRAIILVQFITECDNMFDNASSLYTHSAQKHYYSQLVELFKTNFMRANGMCTSCPNRPINDAQVRQRKIERDKEK